MMWQQLRRAIFSLHGENLAGTVPTGISFVDDVIGGISPRDLIVVGGRTGFGKTELCTQICFNVAAAGRTVGFLALEAEKWEIHQRMLYREVANTFFNMEFSDRPKVSHDVSYRNFYKGLLTTELMEMIDAATIKLESKTSGIEVFYPEDLSAEALCYLIENDCAHLDMIVVDHLHFLTKRDDEREHDSVVKAIKLIRDRALKAAKPMILVSHLRKSDNRFQKTLFPRIDDLHGSSEISKRATGVVLIERGKAGAFSAFGDNTSPTIFNIAKYRHGGSPIQLFGVHNFEMQTQRFSDKYLLMKQNAAGEFEVVENIPRWAKKTMRVNND